MKKSSAGGLARAGCWVALVMVGEAIAAAPAQTRPIPTLAKVSQDWSSAWAAKDLDATLALYSDDVVFMDANGSRISGKNDLRKFFSAVLAEYTARPMVRSLKSEASGDLGYDLGNYTEIITQVAHPDTAIRTAGTYVAIMRKIAGRWLITAQAWTGNVPVPVKR